MGRSTMFALGSVGVGFLALYLGMTGRVDDFVKGVKGQCVGCAKPKDTPPPAVDNPPDTGGWHGWLPVPV